MNTFQMRNPNEPLEPEELESWAPNDFDDVLPRFEASELENELIWIDSFGWQVGGSH